MAQTRMTTIHRSLHTLLALSLLSTSFIALPANAKKLGADPYSLNWLVDQAKYRCTLEQKTRRQCNNLCYQSIFNYV